jgi:hypothetical protein
MAVFIPALRGSLQPRGDLFLPDIGLVPFLLFLNCSLDHFGVIEPPGSPEAAIVQCLSPKLVAIAAETLKVNLTTANRHSAAGLPPFH